MKNVYLALALLLSVNVFSGQVVTVSKTVADLATQNGWAHDSTYLSFPLDGVITVTGTTGNAKYCSDNTAKSMRYYQGCRKGEFAIEALPGAMIQSIKLTYYVTKANSVATTDYGTDGKNIPAANQVKNNETFPVNANRITLYVGRSTNETDGQIRITAFEVTYVTSNDLSVSKTTQELANEYGWANETSLRNFNLNEALSVDVEKDGTMKYTMNTKSCHCYQWLGSFTIRAREGVTIQSVKLTYGSVNAGVLTQNWGVDGKQIAPEDQIASGELVEVNDNAITFYVGTTDTVTNGQIRITKWEVSYNDPNAGESMLRTTTDLGKQYGWADAYCPVNIPFNNAISFHSDKTDNVKYYSTTKSFHCYQWSGGFYFKARPGTIIQSVSLTYDPLNNAVLTKNWGIDGKNIPEEDWIESGAMVSVNGDSVHFFTGDKANTNNCQLHITGFAVIYKDTLAHKEKWEQCTLTESEEVVDVVGDKGYYDWQLSHFQRSTSDVVCASQGTRLLYEGTIATDGVQEGGIKDVSFDWRASDDTKPVQFTVQVGEVTDEVQRANPGSANYVMNYTNQFAVKSNCAFSISMGAQAATAQTQPIIGAVSITPYLLFKQPNHVDTIDTNNDSYDLKPILINNSGEEPVFEVIENTIGQEITIIDGVVDLSDIIHGGYIKVKASCFEGAVYTMLMLYIEVAPRVYFAEANKIVYITDTPFVNPLIAPDSIGAITYTSSNMKVAMVNDTGLVTIMGLGQAVITAYVAATEAYVATSASFNLSVIYIPEEGTYRIETFSQCRKKQSTEGFVYVEGDDAVYDWNLTNFSRDKQDTVAGEQGILLNYGGSISTNGAQEGGVKYMSFNWRAVDPVSPVHFIVNMANTSVSHSQSAVGDASLVLTYNYVFEVKSNTSFSINVRAKETPTQSQIVVGPIQIVPYLLFTNKYVELELPQTTYDCKDALINNTDSVVTYSILSAPAGLISIEDGILDLSDIDEAGDVVVQAQWGEVSTTMTVHLLMPTAVEYVNDADDSNHKVIRDGKLFIQHHSEYYTVLGNRVQ